MKWIFGPVAAAACLICGMLGLTAGINLNPETSVRFVPNWGSVGDWVAGVSALFTFLAACVAMNVWRIQERQRLILQWKADILDYTYTLPYLKDTLSWPDDRDQIGRIAEKFYACIKSYMLMIEYAGPEKAEFYKRIWTTLHDAHNAYIMNGAIKSKTHDAYVAAYLQKFL